MKTLIIEDDSAVRNGLRMALTNEGHVVEDTDDGSKGSYRARTEDFDIILLDCKLPNKNGREVAREIRLAGKQTKIIVTSILSDIQSKIDMLEYADDYLVKPFTFSELSARMRAMARRPYAITPTILQIEDLTIDVNKHKVSKDGKQVYLTRKEFCLFECLAQQKGNVVTRGHIMDKVWHTDIDPFSNTIETHVRNLRMKIKDKNQKIIKTIQGYGYMID